MSLVLTRKVGERILIGNDIIVTIADVQHGNKVRVAIDAPRSVSIHREEVYKQIQREQEDKS